MSNFAKLNLVCSFGTSLTRIHLTSLFRRSSNSFLKSRASDSMDPKLVENV